LRKAETLFKTRNGKHAARSLGDVINVVHHAGLGQDFVILNKQQVDYEADDFMGSEVFACGFV
jgi:hypothetical protein